MSLYESLVHYYCEKAAVNIYISLSVYMYFIPLGVARFHLKKKVSHINKPVKSHSIDRWIDLYIYI